MAENLRSSVSTGCPNALALLNSDASSVTAQNCKNVLSRSDDCEAWTDEKHHLYLSQLEVSFVKQLHQSKGLVPQCSKQNQRNMNMYQKRPIDVHNSARQFTVLRNGCWQKINYRSGNHLSHSSADSQEFLESPWIHHLEQLGMDCLPPSSNMEGPLKAFCAEKHGKGINSHGLATCSQQFSSEGTGQNFLDEDDQSKSNIESHAKRLKTALVKTPSQDQIVPSENLPTPDY